MENLPSNFDFASVAQKLGFIDANDANAIREQSLADQIDQKKSAIKSARIKIQHAELVDSILQPIDSIPGFKLIDLLGRGGMGVVYKAIQINLDRSVALKTILMEKVGGTAIGRFEREARTMAKIQHPNIISVYDFGKQNDQFYFAMEYIDGEDVSDRVKRTKKVDEFTAWGIIRQVAAGLSHAWNAGIVHRDIKPANILLLVPPAGTNIPGNAPLAKVADFGLAIEERDLTADSTRFTEERMIIGSPSYMSPEQFESTSVDFRSDIYSCGATIYEMVTGAKPFAGLSIAKLMSAKVNGELPLPIDEIEASETTKRIISRMMAAEPEYRFENYSELIVAIDDCLERLSTSKIELNTDAETSKSRLTSDIEKSDVDYDLDDDTFAADLDATEQILAKPAAKSTSQLMRIATFVFAVVFAGLLTWVILEQMKYRPGDRSLTIVESLPMYQGEDISGWPITQQSGQVGIEIDELQSTALFVKNGYCRRRLPETTWSNYSISLAAWILNDAEAEIQFGVSNETKTYGVLKLTNSNATLLVRGSSESESQKNSASIDLRDGDYTSISIEKQETDWFIFIDEKFFAAMPLISVDDAMEIRLVATGGKVRFIELNQNRLNKK